MPNAGAPYLLTGIRIRAQGLLGRLWEHSLESPHRRERNLVIAEIGGGAVSPWAPFFSLPEHLRSNQAGDQVMPTPDPGD